MTTPDTTPEHLRYTREHEWALRTESGAVRVGITHYAQESLGDIVFVSLPEVGTRAQLGQTLGEVESTKSVSDLYAPVTGTVTARNEALADTPELVNTDPYGQGWIVEIQVDDLGEVDTLMDSSSYQDMLDAH